MSSEHITPETMKLNETEPQGFTAEPRTISQEVFRMREQVAALTDAVLQLVEVQREVAQRIDGVLSSPIDRERAA